MKIAYLTAGTGNYHCGTCIRDSFLVRGLRARGHDALLVPLYLPLVTEEAGGDEVVPQTPLFMGGVNTYLQQKIPLFRHTPRWLDRLLDAPVLLDFAAKRAGMTDAHELGEMTVSMLRGEAGQQVKEYRRTVAWLRDELQPDLVCISHALLSGFVGLVRHELRVPVVCSLQGEDSFLDALPEPYRGQAWELLRGRVPDVAAFVAVSHDYAKLLQNRLNIPGEQLHVVHNGIVLDDYRHLQRRPPEVPTVGFLSQLIRSKGLETLVRAFIHLKREADMGAARLCIAGAPVPGCEPFLEELRGMLEKAGHGDAVEWRYNLSHREKLEFLAGLSVFSVPATYGESFGLYVIEALAAGVPVVQPEHAAFPELLNLTGGGLLCQPDDPVILARSLLELLRDPARAKRLGDAGRESVFAHFHLDAMAGKFDNILRKYVATA